MRRATLALLLPAAAALLAGCFPPGATRQGGGSSPRSFSPTTSPAWSSFELREGTGYDHAWEMVLGMLVRNFDLAWALKESGYIQTQWHHSWSGAFQTDYRVRVTVKFSENRRKIDLKAEAQRLVAGVWTDGTDTRLLTTLKTDIMGTVGRTAR